MLQLGHSTEQVVDAIVKEANGHVYRLEYAEALGKVQAAAEFGKRTPDFDRAAFELTFFFNESRSDGVTQRHPVTNPAVTNPDNSLAQALALLGKHSDGVILRHPVTKTQQQLRDYLRRADPLWHKTLMEKYYPVMLEVPGGEYYPGCVKPGDCLDTTIVGVTQSHPDNYKAVLSRFRLARTETTFHQYGLFCAAVGRDIKDHQPSWGTDGDNPVVNVSWYNAVEYANWASVQLGYQPAYTIDSLQKDTNNLNQYDDLKWTLRPIPGANGFRLPSEAEWERAARGGARLDTFIYSGNDDLDKVTWYYDNSFLGSTKRSHPVAGKQPNALGLFDMSGNVWEWCWDWYADEYPAGPVADWRGPSKGNYRVLRGGSWNYIDDLSRVARRDSNYPLNWGYYYGFRLSQGY